MNTQNVDFNRLGNRRQRRQIAKQMGKLGRQTNIREFAEKVKQSQERGKIIHNLHLDANEKMSILRRQQVDEQKIRQYIEKGHTVDEAYDMVFGLEKNNMKLDTEDHITD